MREAILTFLEKNSRIDLKELAVILGTDAFDLMVILEGKTLKEVSGFVSDKLSTLDSVLSTATHFILKKYKDHGTIFEKKTRDERMPVTL